MSTANVLPVDSVRVALSIRPLLPREVAAGAVGVLRRVDGAPQVVLDGTAFTSPAAFTFDHVLPPGERPDTREMQAHALRGYNCTLLAYGQTGAGKTHMMGTSESGSSEGGLIQEVAAGLLDRMSTVPGASCVASFVEVYNEEVYDLLADSGESGSTDKGAANPKLAM